MADPVTPAPKASAAPAPAAPPPPKVDEKAKGTASVTATTDLPPPDSRWRFVLDGSFASAWLGGPNPSGLGLFGKDPSDANGFDYTQKTIGVGFGYKIWDPSTYFQLWLGANAGYKNLSGNKNAPGEMHGGYLGASICGASDGLYQREAKDRIFLGPELCGRISALYMGGDSTAGNNFSVDSTKGFGYGLTATLSPIGFQLGTAQVKPYAMVDSWNIPDARDKADAPVLAWGAGLSVGWTFGGSKIVTKTETKEVEKICKAGEDDVKTMYEKVKALREQVKSTLTAFQSLTETLKKQGYGPKEIREAIIRGRVEQLKAVETENLQKAGKKPDEIKTALAAKNAEFKKDAETFVAIDYDHYNLEMPKQVDLTDDDLKNLGACPTREDIYERLNNEREALGKLDVRVEERTKFVYFALGQPPKEIVKVVQRLGLALQFPPILFASNRPTPADIAKIEDFMKANPTFRTTDPNDAKLAPFKAVFQGANEMKKLYRVAQALKGEVPPPNVDIKGLKPEEIEELKNDMKLINVLVEAHTSKAGSLKDPSDPKDPMLALSQRRADAIRYLLIVYGVDEARLRGEGFGYQRPLDDSDNGNEASAAAVTNRRVAFIIDPKRKSPPPGAAAPVPTGPVATGTATPPPPPPVPTGTYKPPPPPPPPPSATVKGPPPPPPPPPDPGIK